MPRCRLNKDVAVVRHVLQPAHPYCQQFFLPRTRPFYSLFTYPNTVYRLAEERGKLWRIYSLLQAKNVIERLLYVNDCDELYKCALLPWIIYMLRISIYIIRGCYPCKIRQNRISLLVSRGQTGRFYVLDCQWEKGTLDPSAVLSAHNNNDDTVMAMNMFTHPRDFMIRIGLYLKHATEPCTKRGRGTKQFLAAYALDS